MPLAPDTVQKSLYLCYASVGTKPAPLATQSFYVTTQGSYSLFSPCKRIYWAWIILGVRGKPVVKHHQKVFHRVVASGRERVGIQRRCVCSGRGGCHTRDASARALFRLLTNVSEAKCCSFRYCCLQNWGLSKSPVTKYIYIPTRFEIIML